MRHLVFSADSESYWDPYFKYRKRCLRAPLWSLSARAAAGCRSRVLLLDVHGRVRFGAWVLGPLQGAAAAAHKYIVFYVGSMLASVILQNVPITNTA